MTCYHAPGAHPSRPFWFADILGEGDRGYTAERGQWKAYLQVDGMVCPIEPAFNSEGHCLEFIRDQILAATTVCDD